MARIIKSETLLPGYSKMVRTSSGKHKFIVEQCGHTRNKSYNIYHCDGCTRGEKRFEENVRGGLKSALAKCEQLEYFYEHTNDIEQML